MAKGTPNEGINGTLAYGLIAHYSFNDGSLADISGNGYDLTQVGTVFNTTDKDGKIGQAKEILATGNYLTSQPKPLSANGTENAVSIWVYIPNLTSSGGILSIAWTPTSGTPALLIQQENNTIRAYAQGDYSSSVNITVGWHNIIYNNDKLYIDKILAVKHSPFSMGGYFLYLFTGYPNAYVCKLDEVRVYNRLLAGDRTVLGETATGEIAELYDMGVNYGDDIEPPTFNTIYTSNIALNSIDLNINCNENATAYYKLYNRNATSPTSSKLKTTHDGTITLTANVLSITNITGLNSYFDYDLYVVAEDMDGNLQTTPSKLQFATKVLEYKLCFANEDYSITFTEDTIENKNTSRNLSYRKPINRTNNITFTKNIDKDNTPYVDCMNDEFLNYISMEDIFTIKLLDTSTNKIKLLVNCRLNKKPNLNVSGSGNREEISIDFEKAVDL